MIWFARPTAPDIERAPNGTERIIRHSTTHENVGGTTEEIKQAIVECLHTIYPRGRAESGISVRCFKGRTGADGQHLIGFGDGAKLTKALGELVAEGIIVSNDEDGEPVFHFKTDARPPVVGHMEEIKLAIVECLCRIHPKELVRVGVELECFKDENGNPLDGANGLSLVELGDGIKIQRALDDLVVEGKIDACEKELNGRQMVHYRVNASDSVTSDRPTLRPVEKSVTPGQRTRFGRGVDGNTLPEAGSTSRDVNLTIPIREDAHNEFKETFSVPMHGGKSDTVKMEVAIAVAAFANAKGGRLFVGVSDDGTPSKLKKDLSQYKNTDKLELAIRNFLDAKLGSLVDVEFGFSGDEYVVIVVPKHKTGKWVYIGDGDFFVRRGNQSRKLNPEQTADYQDSH